MNQIFNLRRLLIGVLSIILAGVAMQAQEKSAKFAHIRFPSEVYYVDFNDDYGFVGNPLTIWRFNPKDLSFDEIVDIHGRGWFTQIQGMAARGNNMYFYINGEGIYRVANGQKPQLVRPREDRFVKNYEEAYSQMSIDPSGLYLLLYGSNENAAVFSILENMTPIVAFNDHVMDAYWLNDCLWAGCVDKVVINRRRGKSMNNEDFMYYDTNDQKGMTKFWVADKGSIPNFGEQDLPVPGSGDIQRLIYNKANGDVLLCLSSSEGSDIFKITHTEAIPVAKLNVPYLNDFAAYGNKIIAVTGGGFVEATYPKVEPQDLKPEPIRTDILQPKLYEGHRPDPFSIYSSKFLDYDKDGNLWISNGNDLFVRYK